MKKTLTLITLLLFFAIEFISCEKYAKDTPKPIKKLIKEGSINLYVTEYECNEKLIYYFEELEKHGSCMYFRVRIFDKEGNILCSDCSRDFNDNKCLVEKDNCVEKRVIWKQEVMNGASIK
jgi:hypothetical protein